MTSEKTSVAILGAGISGLSAAYALQKRGIDVTVYEKKDCVGGVIQTHRKEGWLVEEGPNTILLRDQKIWNLLDELNLSNQIQTPGHEAKKRYIIRDGSLHATPMSLIEFLKTDLLSAPAKFRLLKEPFISAPSKQDESIAGFIHRRLGSEPLDYAVNPFVSGIYAGNPKELSVKHTFTSLFEMEQNHGSIAKGLFKREKNKSTKRALLSFNEGLQAIPKALYQDLGNSVHLNTAVERITRNATNWKLQLGNGKEAEHRAVISTLPAHSFGCIWTDSKSQKSVQLLKDIDYAPMSVLALGFKRNQINHPLDGFGMLVPEVERFTLLGCLFSSSLFVGRAPSDHVLLTCFLGGARHRTLASQSTQDLIPETLPQLKQLLEVEGNPVFSHHTFWEKAIPQYTVGYDKYLQSMGQLESANPGFFMGGNFRGGVAVPDCILNGLETAKQVKEYLK